jgi:hypothetical protein
VLPEVELIGVLKHGANILNLGTCLAGMKLILLAQMVGNRTGHA